MASQAKLRTTQLKQHLEPSQTSQQANEMSFYALSALNLLKNPVSFQEFSGKVVLIVNVASQWWVGFGLDIVIFLPSIVVVEFL